MPGYKREISYKMKIGDIFSGKPVLDGERFNFLELGERQIRRVNIIANIIDKYVGEGEKKYLTFMIDDGSGQLRVRVFGDDTDKFKELNQGDTVIIMGQLRFYNNELYIIPEVMSVRDIRWLLVRKLELEKDMPAKKPFEKGDIRAVKDQIIEMLKKGEETGGVESEKIIMEIKLDPELINQEIKKMLEEGIAYEPRPGVLRYLG